LDPRATPKSVLIKSLRARTMRTNQRFAFPPQNAREPPLAFVPDSITFLDFLMTGPVPD
jgi:hypothetical protein